jgi:hypothetical protein
MIEKRVEKILLTAIELVVIVIRDAVDALMR